MAIKIDGKQISLAVRDLVVHNPTSATTLSSFPLPQRGMLGKEAQEKVQNISKRQHRLFYKEYSVNAQLSRGTYDFKIHGRIDTMYDLGTRIEIEEVKSVVLTARDFQKFNPDLYPEFSEQVLFYAYLLQREKAGVEISTYLTIFNLVNNRQRTFPVDYVPQKVEALLFLRLQNILESVLADQHRQDLRIKFLQNVSLSLPENRPQQQEMMTTITRTISDGRHLMVSAPTGTGKTAGALIPVLKYALIHNKKVFFSTAKNTQHAIVRQTLEPLLKTDLDISALFLRSAQKMCCNDVFLCHEKFCPYAKDYRPRLLENNLIAQILVHKMIEPDLIYNMAKALQLCPAEVLMDTAVYADIIVGDFNYVFDPAVSLHRIFNQKNSFEWILIVDEAHNLYQRSIDYYSPEIHNSRVTELIDLLETKKKKIYRDLKQSLIEIKKTLDKIYLDCAAWYSEQQYCPVALDRIAWEKLGFAFETRFIAYLIEKIKMQIIQPDDPFETFYYRLRRFIQVIKLDDPAFKTYYDARDQGILKIQCCDPSGQLTHRINSFHSVIAMSATLDPLNYYQTVLGFLTNRTDFLSLDSPFPPENRKILILPDLSTRFRQRGQLYPQYANIIKEIIKIRPGNYLCFFPSYEFMQNINLFLGTVTSEKLIQTPSMDDTQRTHFLTQLQQPGGNHLLLGVLGGIFAEGIDYSGDMCNGVLIFSPALPKVSFARELIRAYYNENGADGFAFAYLYPGLNKVIQAAGRLVRSPLDKGIVVLVGERFASEKIHELLPAYWFKTPETVAAGGEYQKLIKKFWQDIEK